MITVKGVGPVWVGLGTVDHSRPVKMHSVGLVQQAWFREVDAPYRFGRGVRLRISPNKFIAAGLCAKMTDRRDDYGALNGRDLDVPADQIGAWGGKVPDQEAEDDGLDDFHAEFDALVRAEADNLGIDVDILRQDHPSADTFRDITGRPADGGPSAG